MRKAILIRFILVILISMSGCYTREDIDTIQYNAWEEGYQEGWTEGNVDGYDKGFESGKESGYDEGYADALSHYGIDP